jgi:hypothetical protein
MPQGFYACNYTVLLGKKHKNEIFLTISFFVCLFVSGARCGACNWLLTLSIQNGKH